jgi:hypothetical protein
MPEGTDGFRKYETMSITQEPLREHGANCGLFNLLQRAAAAAELISANSL